MNPSSRRAAGPQSLLSLCSLALLASCVVGALHAAEAGKVQEPAPDKSRYTLFNPTPRENMREMSTDRPDQTESAYSVDAGHFQVEMDLVSAVFDRDRSGGRDVCTKAWGIGPVNLKLGLLNNFDVQFLLEPYVNARVEDRVAGTSESASGFGDLQTRLKINLWGNDGGKTALAIMPFVKWPLPSSGLRNGSTEGGVIFPLAVELPRGWSMGLMTEFDFVRSDQSSYDTEFVNSVTLSHDIAGNLGGYVEFFTVTSTARNSKWQGQADIGFTYALNQDTRLDWGCNFGVTQSAPDFNPFLGLSWRF